MKLFNQDKTILIYCEESGAFANLYREAGYSVIVRDMKIDPAHDIQLQEYIKGGIHGFLGFPPCTHLAGSGARWWASKGEEALREGLMIADACMRVVALYKPEWWAIENPVGRLSRYFGKPKMTYNPYEFGGYLTPPGDAYSKRTCLWGQFQIPKKKPVENTEGSKMHLLPPSPERAKLRSKTPMGFANAFCNANR